MATNKEYIDYVCEQISNNYRVRSRMMFGEYMIYINDKPILLVCDNTVFVKMLDCIGNEMSDCDKGFPYTGSKEHYILPVDDRDFMNKIISILEPVVPLPKKKK